jgi:molybdenum cofactor cytidylyltransferase
MPDRPPLVAVLAAGAARRFDPDVFGAKLDAMLAGRPVGQWVLDAVADAGLEPGVIVVPGKVPAFAVESGWPTLTNVCASDGIGTSIALAASAALGQGRAMLVLLADMPLVSAAHLRALLSHPGAATAYPGSKAGVPALVPVDLLPHLAELEGNVGAGPFLSMQRGLARIDVPPAMLLDIDRPEDLALAEEVLRSQRHRGTED